MAASPILIASTNIVGQPVQSGAQEITVQATVTGTGSVSATVQLQVSNDKIGWLNLFIPGQEIILNGTDLASDGSYMTANWQYMRAVVTNLSGTNALVTVTVGS